VVDLVGKRPGGELLPRDGAEIPVLVPGLHHHPERTRHLLEDLGKAQASLLAHLFPLGLDDPRVHQDMPLSLEDHHDDPPGNTHLGRRETHAVPGLHGVPHVPEKRPERVVELRDLLRGSAQRRIRIDAHRKYRHTVPSCLTRQRTARPEGKAVAFFLPSNPGPNGRRC
jgi:hypothetical protein